MLPSVTPVVIFEDLRTNKGPSLEIRLPKGCPGSQMTVITVSRAPEGFIYGDPWTALEFLDWTPFEVTLVNHNGSRILLKNVDDSAYFYSPIHLQRTLTWTDETEWIA
jgi:hypothetical protein